MYHLAPSAPELQKACMFDSAKAICMDRQAGSCMLCSRRSIAGVTYGLAEIIVHITLVVQVDDTLAVVCDSVVVIKCFFLFACSRAASYSVVRGETQQHAHARAHTHIYIYICNFDTDVKSGLTANNSQKINFVANVVGI
jgi:hypothetical protein